MCQADIDRVTFARATRCHTRCDVENVFRRFDDAFGQEKACRKFAVVTVRAHQNREAASLDANLKRFLTNHDIGLLTSWTASHVAGYLDGNGRSHRANVVVCAGEGNARLGSSSVPSHRMRGNSAFRAVTFPATNRNIFESPGGNRAAPA